MIRHVKQRETIRYSISYHDFKSATKLLNSTQLISSSLVNTTNKLLFLSPLNNDMNVLNILKLKT